MSSLRGYVYKFYLRSLRNKFAEKIFARHDYDATPSACKIARLVERVRQKYQDSDLK